MMDSELEGLLIPKEEILEELSRLREEIAVTMKWIHIGTIEVVIKATFKEGIDSEIHLSITDRRINNLRDGCLGTMIGNLYAGKLMFDIHPRIAYNLADQDFSRVLTLHQDFKRKDLMKEGNRPYSITYRIAYALSNTHHSDLFLRKEYIEIPQIFKEFAKDNGLQRVRELKQVCNNLPKLAIPQDEDELVVYTDANDYRWAAVLMKKTTTGEEPCRYTGGLFTEQQARVWHINEKEFFVVWKAFKKWPLFLLAKNSL
ncbi:movement protein [Sesamum angolense]|uniref:Movement protein n=1 Tax=Sesamum angolense TaxID=2727404 RepID=A0AAE1VUB7_9LAMI|nr:movement protein [Sesamum angolense]